MTKSDPVLSAFALYAQVSPTPSFLENQFNWQLHCLLFCVIYHRLSVSAQHRLRDHDCELLDSTATKHSKQFTTKWWYGDRTRNDAVWAALAMPVCCSLWALAVTASSTAPAIFESALIPGQSSEYYRNSRRWKSSYHKKKSNKRSAHPETACLRPGTPWEEPIFAGQMKYKRVREKQLIKFQWWVANLVKELISAGDLIRCKELRKAKE